jgi:molecular chaperone GrpE
MPGLPPNRLTKRWRGYIFLEKLASGLIAAVIKPSTMSRRHRHERKAPLEERGPEQVSSPDLRPPTVSPQAAGPSGPLPGEEDPGEVVQLGRDEFKRLQAQASAVEEYKDKYLRSLASSDNARKRMEKEKSEFKDFAVQDLVGELLPVLDNFERALLAAPPAGEKDTYRQGIEMIYKQLKEALGKEGLVEIKAQGERFDPFFHEAVAEEPSDAYPDGTVLQELQKGYLLKGRLLRPAAVKVSRSSVPSAGSGANEKPG